MEQLVSCHVPLSCQAVCNGRILLERRLRVQTHPTVTHLPQDPLEEEGDALSHLIHELFCKILIVELASAVTTQEAEEPAHILSEGGCSRSRLLQAPHTVSLQAGPLYRLQSRFGVVCPLSLMVFPVIH